MLFALLTACENDPASWYYGEDLSVLTIVPVAWDEGVYPDISVLDDPNNPFAEGIDVEVKWEILATDCTPGFYAFATALAYQPTGEHQFYTAQCLQTVYESGRLAPDDTWWGWSAAVRGYQVVLDEFPGAVTYDATGTIPYDLAPLAWAAIESLGATPEGEAP
jgi:hypothetical protein